MAGGFNRIVGIGLGLFVAASLIGGGKVASVLHHHSVFGSGPCSGLGSVSSGQINGAANQIGISCRVVRAQLNMESGGNPGSLSPAGAEGVAQFMPGTWNGDGCSGSPWNVSDSMVCYVRHMKGLEAAEHGNLRNVLAAYNAGTGNLGAGYGYADSIMSAAGV